MGMRDIPGGKVEEPYLAHRAEVELEEPIKDVHRARVACDVALKAQQQTLQARLQ